MRKRLLKKRTEGWRGIPLLAVFLLCSCAHEIAHVEKNSVTASHSSESAKSPMHSRVFQWSDMKAQPSNIGILRNVFDNPTLTLAGYSCHITTLNPGKEPHPPHQHPEEELLVIKEGTLEVMQNGVTNQVGAGAMVFCASNELHGWRNTSTSPVTYYVIKVYPHDLPKPGHDGELK
jgi:XRE family transcriptional regulator, regulator of sulfur utilization